MGQILLENNKRLTEEKADLKELVERQKKDIQLLHESIRDIEFELKESTTVTILREYSN